MRNLKRALSLALAAVMVLGMMVIGAGAASTYEDFTDKDEIQNKEAVNTMVSLGVLAGKNDGSTFDPTGIVTRAEMAKIVAVSLNGGKDPVMGADAKTVFTDVPANHWAVAYIAYCVQQNIIAGRGNGTFGPEEPVTGSAAAKMFLCALGYRADLEGLTGNNWEINTNVLANQDANLYDGLAGLNASAGLSRDNTAQMLYNAVQAQEVKYDNLFGDHSDVVQARAQGTMLANRFGVVKVEGVVVANDVFGLDNYSSTPTGKTRFVNSNTYTVTNTNGSTTTRSYDAVYPVTVPNDYVGRRVVIYVRFPNALAPNAVDSVVVGQPILSEKNTIATTAGRLKDDDAVRSFLRDSNLSIGAEKLDDNTANNYRGILNVSKDTFNFASGDVALANGINARGTQITFIDHTGDGTVDYILKETQHLAKITVYNETDKELTLAGIGKIDFKDVANVADYAVNDMVLYAKYNNTYYFDKPETVSGTFEAYDAANTKMTMDGVSYASTAVSYTAASTTLMNYVIGRDQIGQSYTLYLDKNGNCIAVDVYEETVGNYALVLGSTTTTNPVMKEGKVKLLLADGTTGTYTVNLAASASRFGWANLGTSAKETNMVALLDDSNNKLRNTIVTYIIGEDNTVTIGNPAQQTAYASLYNSTGVATNSVSRVLSNYTFPTGSVAGGASVIDFVGAKATTGSANVVVNDSTVFFFRDGIADSVDPVVVQGLSKLPTAAINPSKVINVVYRTNTSSNTAVAKAVYVDAQFKGALSYLYVSDDYVGTQLSATGERIFTYPVVFEDGTANTIKVREADATGIAKEQIYSYTTTTAGYTTLAQTPSGAVDVAVGGEKNLTINDYVVTYAENGSVTLEWGYNKADTTHKDKSYTLVGAPRIWNVEDGAKPYASNLTENSTVAVATDSNGFISVAFVKDSNVSARTVTNKTGASLGNVYNLNGSSLNNGSSVTVFSGFDFIFDSVANVSYSKITDGNVRTDGLVATVSGGKVSISMPAFATLEIGTASSGGGGKNMSLSSTLTEINDALEQGNVTLTGDYTPVVAGATGRDTKIIVPAGRTLTIEGNYTANNADSILGTLAVTGTYNLETPATDTNATLEGTVSAATIDTTNIDGSGKLIVRGNVTAGSIAGGKSIETKSGALTVSGTINNSPLTVDGGTVRIATIGNGAVTVNGGSLTVANNSGVWGSVGTGGVTVADGTFKSGNLGGTLSVGAGNAEVTGDVTTSVEVTGAGTAKITGTVPTVTDVAAGGTLTVEGNITTAISDNNGTINTRANVLAVTTNAGTINSYGTIGTITDNEAPDGVINLYGNVTTDIVGNAGAINVKESLTIKDVSANTGKINVDTGKTLTITDAAAKAALTNIKGVAAGAKLTLTAESSDSVVTADGFYDASGTAIDSAKVPDGTYTWTLISSGPDVYGWKADA